MDIEFALKAYYREYGIFPKGTNARIMELIRNNPRGVPLIEAPAGRFSRSGEYLDPWGNPYRILISEHHESRVYSLGEDSVDDGGRPDSDDIISWR